MGSSSDLVHWNAPMPSKWDATEAWQRQPCDNPTQWEAFKVFLTLPIPRYIAEVGNRTMRPMKVIVGWAKANHWFERVAVFDNHVHKHYSETVIATVECAAIEAGNRHAEILSMAGELAAREIKKYVEASRESTVPGLVKIETLTKLIDSVVKLERLINGEITDHVGVEDLTALSVPQLHQLKKLQQMALIAAKQGSKK